MNKTCQWCGQKFTPPSQRGNAQKYCSQYCRIKGYNKKHNIAQKKYQENKPKTTRIHIRKCRYCGKQYIGIRNNMYCSIQCKKYSRQEQSRRTSLKNNLKGRSEKQLYFDNLGNSNLREHRHKKFKDEEKLIKAEKRRLRI